jgi:CofD-related protein of GAK system
MASSRAEVERVVARTSEIRISRTARLPDPVRLARCRRAPELGPRILFFSGGTALRETSCRLVDYTHNSIHLITPFDSGGSSAHLRHAFRMLAVGDLRNRLMALADQSVKGHPEIFSLFAFRFPTDSEPDKLRSWLESMVQGHDPRVAAIADPMRKIIRNHLRFFMERMPEDFDLAGANIGNLILAGGYLNQQRHIDPVIYLFSRLVEVRGIVRPITSENLHLAARLRDGSIVVGQHLLTGKEAPPVRSPVERIFLARNRNRPEPVEVEIRKKVRELILSSELICYPMGSFYTSLIANLLPSGVGDAIAQTDVPKVYIANVGSDPEQLGVSVADSVETLVDYLRASCTEKKAVEDLLRFVLIDGEAAGVRDGDRSRIERLGLKVIDVPMLSAEPPERHDPDQVAQILVSMA